MAYAPAQGDRLKFQLQGSWLPPDGAGLDLGLPYAPPRGDQLHFHFRRLYQPPPGDAILFGGPPVDPPDPPEPEEKNLAPDFALLWGQLPQVDHQRASGWKRQRPVHASIRMAQRLPRGLDQGRRMPWARLQNPGSGHGSGWGAFSKRETNYSIRWHARARLDQRRRIPWGEFLPADKQGLALRWANPEARQPSVASPYAQLDPLDILDFAIPWGNPHAQDQPHRTIWGRQYYEEICFRRYEPPPGDAVQFDIRTPIIQVGDRDHIVFFLDQWAYDRRCWRQEPSGWRDAYFYIKPEPGQIAPSRSWYHVLNQALLTRLPDRAPIDVGGITMATDMNSFCWTFSAELKSQASLELLRNIGEPLDVEVNINGHLWIIQVERWTEGRHFIGGSRGVNGRSLSANLATPYGPIITGSQTQARTARQLAEEALDSISGWELDWQIVDWLVPGGLWSAAEQTPMQIIQDIAAAAHGFVQSHAREKKITVRPRYKDMPWNWSALAPDMGIPEAMILSTQGERQPKAQYNASFVSGTMEGGIGAKVVRQGTAGDQAAPMFTHSLITDTDVALAKGRGILAESGDWERQTIVLPLFPDPKLPGLVLPGTILKITRSGGSWWMGQVTGISITASRAQGGVIVRQTLDVERYHGD